MAEEARRRRRGPRPNPDRGRPCGFRITERTRFELQAAALFVGKASIQDTIALAVDEFLDRTRTTPGFTEALRAAEANIQRRSGVSRIPPTDD